MKLSLNFLLKLTNRRKFYDNVTSNYNTLQLPHSYLDQRVALTHAFVPCFCSGGGGREVLVTAELSPVVVKGASSSR